MPHATVNGVRLHYEEHGREHGGSPILLIPGTGSHAGSWASLVPPLAARFRLIALDNRGAGRSDAPPGPYTTRLMAEDAAALLDHLGIERAHVVGRSMGGMVAQELALAHPGRIDRLVLFATWARPHEYHRLNHVHLEAAREHGLDERAIAVFTMPWVYSPAFMQDPARVQRAVGAIGADPHATTPDGYRAQSAAVRAHDALDRLHAIRAPTLVLAAAEDLVAPPAYARAITERIPAARLHILERGGHAVTAEYPDAVASALLDFLTQPLS